MLCLLCCVMLLSECAAATDLYVAVDGNDQNPGTVERPLATLAQAREAIRRIKKAEGLPEGGVTVHLRGGVHPLQNTFMLTEEDSGRVDAPIVYRAYKNEQVRIIGGRRLCRSVFTVVSEPAVLERMAESVRGKILQIDLKGFGIQELPCFAIPKSGGIGRSGPLPIELFFNDQRMQLARWPNESWAQTGKVLDAGSEDEERGGTFLYSDSRPSQWQQAKDLWVNGYWVWDWYNESIKVESIDAEARSIKLAKPHGYGLKEGRRYFALNLLEELDMPGEYFLDRDSGILYFYPPGPMTNHATAISLLGEPLVILDGASHIILRGLTLECSRGYGVDIKGGSDILVAGCTLRNLGADAVVIRSGTRHGVVSCDIYQIGGGGILLRGGDRQTLSRAEDFAVNNHIHHYAQLLNVYQGAIEINGVGMHVAHNLIHNAPHLAIWLAFPAIDNIIEFNRIHHVTLDTNDCGAIYTGRDWTSRGNISRYNLLYDIPNIGIYLDDCSSEMEIFGNVFVRCGISILIGGGRDNKVQNNIFADCGDFRIDSRGVGWMRSVVYGTMKMRLQEINYKQPPWADRYPELAQLDKYYQKDQGVPPGGNVVEKNVRFGGGWLWMDEAAEKGTQVRDNYTEGDPGFLDPNNLNYQLRNDSQVYKTGFKRIPFERIGLYQDEYRKGE